MTANRYPGINPHLNSALQQKNWKSFHTTHLVHLTEAIVPNLPRGYFVKLEDSLQFSIGSEAGKYAVADILIRQHAPSTAVVAIETTAPTLTLDVFNDGQFVPAAVIYQDNRPITRLELLSPANKRYGSHNAAYLKKRDATLQEGIRLVELDYLHETPPALSRLPSYIDGETGASPYMIIVSDPHTILGGMAIYGFGVLDKMPTISIPLANKDTVVIDFGAAYQRTFTSNPFFSDILTNDQQPPVNFWRYAKADQTLILQQMATIAAEKTE